MIFTNFTDYSGDSTLPDFLRTRSELFARPSETTLRWRYLEEEWSRIVTRPSFLCARDRSLVSSRRVITRPTIVSVS